LGLVTHQIPDHGGGKSGQLARPDGLRRGNQAAINLIGEMVAATNGLI